MKLVELEWLDSGLQATPEDWMPVKTLISRHKLATVKTAGYLAADDEQAYYIVGTYDPLDMQGLNLTVIAKASVKAIKYLEATHDVRPN